jgi:hypothetical protein
VKLFRPTHAVLGAAAAATALALAQGLPAQAMLATSWHVVFSQHYGPASNYSGYTAVVAPSATSAWAFGSTNIGGLPAPGTPVAEQWNGTTWQRSTLPSGLTSEIIAASAISPNDVWAVTEVGGDVLHWNGSQWSVAEQVPGASSGAMLTDVIAFSDSDVWVFGASGAGPGLGAWHYDGTTWTQVTGRGGGVGFASALSPTDIWGLGSTARGPAGDEIVHYNGSAWQRVTATTLTSLDFSDIMAVSDTDVWATGVVNGITTKQRLVQLSNGVWSRVKIPFTVGSLGWLAPDGHGGIWLEASTSSTKTEILHRSATGRWTETTTPGLMGQMALIPGTTSLWGVGWSNTGSTGANAQIWAHGSAAAALRAR